MGRSAILSVRIISDAKNAVDGLNAATSGVENFSQKFLGIGPGPLAVGGAVAAGIGAVTKELYDLGERFDKVTDTIRVGTGATGDALDGLVDVAKNVATTVPASFEDAGQTVADLSTRLGLTGDTLQTVASQYLEAGRILGEQVDINATSAAFSAFQISGEGVTGAMDTLFRVSQATGVGMNDLAASVQKNAPAMQALGFSFENSAAMVGMLDKAGVDADATLAAMKKGLVSLAQPGEDLQAAFQRVTGEIGTFIEKGDTAGALDLAGKVFGTRGASQMVAAIQSGSIAMGDLMAASGATGDTILGVGEETQDAAEKWAILKNKGLAAIEPLASAVFGFASDALGAVVDFIDGIDFGQLSSQFQPLIDALQPVITACQGAISQIGETWTAIKPVIQPVLDWLSTSVQTVFETIGGVISGFVTITTGLWQIIQGIFTGDWGALWEGVQTVASGAWTAIASILSGAWSIITSGLSALGSTIINIFTNAWNGAKNAAVNAGGRLLEWVRGLPGQILSGLGNLASLLWNAGRDLIQGMINGVRDMAGNIVNAATNVVGGAVDAVKNFLGIHSPSRLFYEMGVHTGEGMALGITSQAGRVAAAYETMATPHLDPEIPVRLTPKGTGNAGTVYNITVNGALDAVSVARQIERLLAQSQRRSGRVVIA